MPLKSEVETDKSFSDEIRLEYRHIDSREGKESVRVSREISALQNTVSQKQVYQGWKRLNYRDSSGRIQNLLHPRLKTYRDGRYIRATTPG